MASTFPEKNIYCSYFPDSQVDFNAHPEFSELVPRFINGNVNNNSGDIPRLWSFMLNCKQVLNESIPGDFAELGVYKGNTAAILAYYASRASRLVFLFDTFEGFRQADIKGVDAGQRLDGFKDTSIDFVKSVIGEDSLACRFVPGHFPGTFDEQHRSRNYALVNLDCDLYEPMKAGLEIFYPLLSRGGILFLHDYSSMHWAGAKLAVDEFCRNTGEYVILMPDKSGSAFLRKSR